MSEQDKQPTEAPAEEVKEVSQQPSIADIIGEKQEEKPEPKTVPEAAFLEEKKARKALERELKSLRSQIEEGATVKEVNSSLDDIAEEFGVDKKFLSKLTSALRKDVEAEAENKVNARLKPFEEQSRAERIKSAFEQHYNAAMKELKDYDGIVNKDVIFALSLNSANASKNIPQLIEETYGNAVSGRRSIESTTPQRAAMTGDLDFERAGKDSEYLAFVMKEPKLKAQFLQKAQEISSRN